MLQRFLIAGAVFGTISFLTDVWNGINAFRAYRAAKAEKSN